MIIVLHMPLSPQIAGHDRSAVRNTKVGRDTFLPDLADQFGSQSVSDVLDLAWELGVSKATAYHLLKAFRTAGTVVSRVDRKRGRSKGHSVLDKDLDLQMRARRRGESKIAKSTGA